MYWKFISIRAAISSEDMAENNLKLALVTGASGGIGAAIAKELAKHGLRVILVARRKNVLEQVLSDIEKEGGQGIVFPCDTSSRKEVISLAAKVKSDYGVPDILVNNAGCYFLQEFCDKDYDSWENMISLNILGYLFMIGEFLPEMKARHFGHIINITSDSERFPSPGLTVYTGTKFFWAGASEALRKEITGSGVKVTNILPGYVWTEGLEFALTDETGKRACKNFGLGDPQDIIDKADKMLTPEDVAQSVWEVVNKASNVCINDVLIRDAIQ